MILHLTKARSGTDMMPTFNNVQTQTYLQPLQKSGTSEEYAEFFSEATHETKAFTQVFSCSSLLYQASPSLFIFLLPLFIAFQIQG